MQIFNEFTVPRLLVLQTLVTRVYNHWAYKYAHGTQRVNKGTPKCLPLNFAKF